MKVLKLVLVEEEKIKEFDIAMEKMEIEQVSIESNNYESSNLNKIGLPLPRPRE